MQNERLTYLFEQYSRKLASSEEVSELKLFIQQEGSNEQFSDVLSELMERYPALDSELASTAHLADKVLQMDKLGIAADEYLKETVIAKPPVRLLWKWGWAAAIMIILATVAYLWFQPQRKNTLAVFEPSHEKNDIAPGGDKAVLTLADGSKILLDSASNGQLAMQGNARIIKDAEGKISYDITAQKDQEVMLNTMTTPKGGKYQLTLPDGSKVWLNAASSITFPATFSGNERKIKVMGEVYLEVAKDKSKPFMVDVNGRQTVEVLGTSFNINAYEDENVIRTTLIDGSVKVSHDGSVILEPGQQAILALVNPNLQDENAASTEKNAGKIIVGYDADQEQVMAWKHGFFYFKNADLPTVMKQLARWYDLDVVYEGKVSKQRFEGKVPMDASLSQVLSVLEENQVYFRIEGKKLIVHP